MLPELLFNAGVSSDDEGLEVLLETPGFSDILESALREVLQKLQLMREEDQASQT